MQDFDRLIPLGGVFAQHSRGVATSRDAWAYNFDQNALGTNIERSVGFYNEELARWQARDDRDMGVDRFVRYDDTTINWSRDLKQDIQRERRAEFSRSKIRNCLYRPFTQLKMFFDRILNEEVCVFPSFVPTELSESENRLICLTGPGSEKPFLSVAGSEIIDLHLSGGGCSTQAFPFYTYAKDGTHRRENITDWALEQFRSHYADPSITKWDIFHYVYAVLHHPDYRERYAANLRRELPRIPFASALSPTLSSRAESRDPAPAGTQQRPEKEFSVQTSSGGALDKNDSLRRSPAQAATGSFDSAKGFARESLHSAQDDTVRRATSDLDVFRAFVTAGQRLAEIHVHYEQQLEYPLTKGEKAGEKLDYPVTKMKMSKDKTSLIYNKFLTLSGIPPETYEYRLGNRSALDWIIDQYQFSTDKRSGITNDPNRENDPTYILRLIGQVITVSLETVKIVKAFPELVVG